MSGDYHAVPMGGPQNHRCKIILRNVKTPVNGFQYIGILEKYTCTSVHDMPDPVSDSDDEQIDDKPKPRSLAGDPVQLCDHPEACEFAVLRKNLGWCGVVGSPMSPLRDFQRGPLRKPRIAIQAMSAFKELEADYAPETQKSTIKSLRSDENCAWLRTTVCLQISNVEPNDWDWDHF